MSMAAKAKKLNKMDKLALEILANWRKSQGASYLRMPHEERLTKLVDMDYVEQLENVHTGFKAFRITTAGLAAIGQDAPKAEGETSDAPMLLATRTETGYSVKRIYVDDSEGETGAAFGAGDKVVIRRDAEQDTDFLLECQSTGIVGSVVHVDEQGVVVSFRGDEWRLTANEIELWTPEADTVAMLIQERDRLRAENEAMRHHLHDLAMLEGATDAGEVTQRADILRQYE
jgi:L-lactate utilization protein LutC